jgi:phosphatidylethanolamine-binding protein (PEBP) family uncharacterized protein
MRGSRAATPIVLLVVLALGGCGNSGPAVIKPIKVPLQSSAIQGGELPAVYTCDGKNISPPLTWGAVPADIEELALFALEATPGTQARLALSIDWAMAGINPALHHLKAGEVPQGGFVLSAGSGRKHYSVCPAKGQTKRYLFTLYALPSGVHASPQISGVELFSNLNKTAPEFKAPAYGEISATYTRK